MAAKAKVTPKAKAVPVAKKATAAKAVPKGLQLSAAQWAAYSKSFGAAKTAARRKAAIQGGVNRLRISRLSVAHGMQKQYNATRTAARTAAIASYAASRSLAQSRLGHQNAALRARIGQDAYRHSNSLGRLQYAAAGEKAYAHNAVMRTLTTAQAARSYQASVLARISQVAKTAAKPAAKAAAKRGRPVGSGVAGGVKQVKAVAKASAKASSTSKKAPVKTAKGRTAPDPWAGDEETPNCVITAIANHLLYVKGIMVSAKHIAELTSCCDPEPAIEDVLWQVYLTGWPNIGHTRLTTYASVDWEPVHEEVGGLLVGFESENGPHAALSRPGGTVVSWGSVMARSSPVEEAWELQWNSAVW